ncbi:MAG: YdiU family protein [Cyanobacteria bacterium P01_D01_bin.73]
MGSQSAAAPNPWLSLEFEPAFAALGEEYFDVVQAASFPKHDLRFRNDALLERFGLTPQGVTDQQFVEAFGQFAGREPLLAMCYHGYQFGYYNRQLGDGRGFLYGQVRGQDGELYDLATKGSGSTPYSRGGDGRLTLKGGMREVLASELLARLKVRTSRCLCLIETGEELWRGDEPSPTRSSVMVRTGRSHLRFGTFERLHYMKRPDLVQKLLNHAIATYYPHLIANQDLEAGNSIQAIKTQEIYAQFYAELVQRVAQLCAQWMTSGFCHAVLNTDNMLVTGESFDYGPFAFINSYDPTFTAAYFDHQGRYAYGRQPTVCRTNLELLQTPLGLVMERGDMEAGIAGFEEAYDDEYQQRMAARLGFVGLSSEDADDLVGATVRFLAASQVSYSDFFIHLRQRFQPSWRDDTELAQTMEPLGAAANGGPLSGEALQEWGQWRLIFHRLLQALSDDELGQMGDRLTEWNSTVSMVRPVIESLWEPITNDDDWSVFNRMVKQIWD